MSYQRFLPQGRQSDLPTHEWWAWREHQIHIARRINPSSPVRIVIVHGAGGNASALFPLASSVMPDVELVAIDLPLYGETRTKNPSRVRYSDWVEVLVDFLIHHDDSRPVILFGASMGGLLAVEVATRSGLVKHVMVTCLLDPHTREARQSMLRSKILANYGPQILRIISGPLKSLRIPVNRIAAVEHMSRDVELTDLLAKDTKAGGVKVPIGFLRSFIEHPPVHTSLPVTLVHPEKDDWTPHHLSEQVLSRFTGATETQLLEECGHFPLEEPGLTTLAHTAQKVVDKVLAQS